MRPKLSYANVMATVAVFIALGGASYAAFKLPKNSVGSKQLKKNAVTTKKIKNESVTAAKVKSGTLTGKQIDSSTLGTVPDATHAGSADSATKAADATNALDLAAPEAPHLVGAPGEPPFENGYENFSGSSVYAPAEFYRDRQCVVHLDGLITGLSDKTAFTLPDGFRPAAQTVSLVYAAGLVGALFVSASGEVFLEAPTSSSNFGLGGQTFRAANC